MTAPVGGPKGEQCKRCYYYSGVTCHRYPVHAIRAWVEWCGEFVAKEGHDEKPKAKPSKRTATP